MLSFVILETFIHRCDLAIQKIFLCVVLDQAVLTETEDMSSLHKTSDRTIIIITIISAVEIRQAGIWGQTSKTGQNTHTLKRCSICCLRVAI